MKHECKDTRSCFISSNSYDYTQHTNVVDEPEICIVMKKNLLWHESCNFSSDSYAQKQTITLRWWTRNLNCDKRITTCAWFIQLFFWFIGIYTTITCRWWVRNPNLNGKKTTQGWFIQLLFFSIRYMYTKQHSHAHEWCRNPQVLVWKNRAIFCNSNLQKKNNNIWNRDMITSNCVSALPCSDLSPL